MAHTRGWQGPWVDGAATRCLAPPLSNARQSSDQLRPWCLEEMVRKAPNAYLYCIRSRNPLAMREEKTDLARAQGARFGHSKQRGAEVLVDWRINETGGTNNRVRRPQAQKKVSRARLAK